MSVVPCSAHARAALVMAATALFWSTGGLAIKVIDLHPMAITGARSAISALVLALIMGRRLSFSLSPAALGAALGYSGMLVTNVIATKLTTSANAILLAYTAPVYVALLAPAVLKERTRPSDWVFVAVCLAGMVLFFLDELTSAGLWGTATATATGLCYAVFTLCMRSQKAASPVESVILGHALTALCGLPFLVHGLPDAAGLGGLVYLGVIQQGLPLLLYVWSIKRLGALEAVLITTLEPICNPVWVALGYGELPGPWAVAGGAVVIGAVTLRGVAGALRFPRRRTAA